MLRFSIQPCSEVPASAQLLNQISFAIACGQYAPGYRLPSTRQLAMQTGLHRNTISKVYRQLEEMGLVETRASSGIYVSALASPVHPALDQFNQQAEAYQLVRKGLDQLLSYGCTLAQARELFLEEIDWRLRCSSQVWISVPRSDLGSGRLMAEELQQALQIPIQLVPLEELEPVLKEVTSGTVLTIRYFTSAVEAVAKAFTVRVVPVDIYDYDEEVEMVKNLPINTCLGLISLSRAIMEVADVIVQSIRGEDLLVVKAKVTDLDQVRRVVRRAQVIICDSYSHATVKAVIREARPDLIRLPDLVCAESYVSQQSVEMLRRELGC
ncbi:MAG: GntR family transcriptional regulator [Synechococcaceae cyanobacterium SM2_3_1]|nr:GntR family transcriptional regulator [Synechococcaceae cyanobacterium SM2_3_1]